MFPELERTDTIEMSLHLAHCQHCYIPFLNVLLQGHLLELQVERFHCGSVILLMLSNSEICKHRRMVNIDANFESINNYYKNVLLANM